jgi:ADP-heptose:LPS heptosyltransferase
LIEGCGFFDEFHQCDADPFSLRRSSEIDGLAGWLRGSGFDAAFILLGDQYAHLLAAAGIPVRVGVKGTPLESCLTHVYEIGSPRTWGPSERLNALRCIGFEVEDSVPVLTAWPSAVSSARAWLAELGMLAAGGFVVLHPFGSTRRQWWDLANAERLAEKVRQKHGLTTVLIGKDRVGTRSGDGLINAAGELSLPETIALIGDARAVISTDSGPFHIAGAMRRPVIGLFRSRRPEHAGRYPNAKAIFGEDSRCERTCQWDRCASAPCRQMAAIPVDAALTILDQKLHDL